MGLRLGLMPGLGLAADRTWALLLCCRGAAASGNRTASAPCMPAVTLALVMAIQWIATACDSVIPPCITFYVAEQLCVDCSAIADGETLILQALQEGERARKIWPHSMGP